MVGMTLFGQGWRDMTREKSDDNTRALTPTLITQGLGYCCLWAFFQFHRRTGLIATRLGIDPRTVRRWKARVREGEFTCEGKGNCMKCAVKIKNQLRKC